MKTRLLCKSFLVTGINSNLTDADDHTIWLDTYIEMIFDDEEDVFHGFAAKDGASTTNINEVLMEYYDSY